MFYTTPHTIHGTPSDTYDIMWYVRTDNNYEHTYFLENIIIILIIPEFNLFNRNLGTVFDLI
jgi:hypothetical protein